MWGGSVSGAGRATVCCGVTGRWGRGVRERGGARGLGWVAGSRAERLAGLGPVGLSADFFLIKTFFYFSSSKTNQTNSKQHQI